MLKDRTIVWWNESENKCACFAVCDTKERAETIAEAWRLVWNEANEHCDDEEHELYDVALDVDFIRAFLAPFKGVEVINPEWEGVDCLTSF